MALRSRFQSNHGLGTRRLQFPNSTKLCMHGMEFLDKGHEERRKILFIEPFYGGSHRQLVDILVREFGGEVFTLPPTKWHWRTRVSALHFAMNIPPNGSYQTLFASSVLNLCELVSLRPDLSRLHKVLYFHENQLVYPVRKQQERDFQYGYNQILSCLVADRVLFNSHFNMKSFLDTIDSYFHLMPDHRPKGLAEQIRPKCSVLYFPVEVPHSVGVLHLDQKQDLGEVVTERQHDETLDLNVTAPPVENMNLEIDLYPGSVVDSQHALQSFKEGEGEGLVCDTCSLHMDSNSTTPTVKATMYSDCTAETCVPKCLGTENENDSKSSRQFGEMQGALEGCTTLTQPTFSGHLSSSDKPMASLEADLTASPLHILWPHRWEHDKGPDGFSSVLMKLVDAGLEFCVSILGAHTSDIPVSFEHVLPKLGSRVIHKGHLPRDQYWTVLQQADVVVSTAEHEFFGVAMLEATICGCYPLCPNRLVYPEVYPAECLYNTEQQLFKRLRRFCQRPQLARCATFKTNLEKYTWSSLKNEYSKVLLHV